MDIVIKLSQFLLSLSLLIILHELGHFILAKLFKTRVEKFYLFFDVKFSLFKKKIGETVYGIGWLPLGGYVKIAGMIDESMDTEQMKKEPQPWEFRSKPAWQRLIIMLGGVIVNFVLAFIIYIGMAWYYGEKYVSNESVKDGVWVVSDDLKNAGMQNGDKIVSIDGQKLEKFNEAQAKILTAETVEVKRNNENITLNLPKDFIGKQIENKGGMMISVRSPFVVGMVSEESANKEVLQPKDLILEVNGQSIKFFDEADSILKPFAGQEVDAKIKRDDQVQEVKLRLNDEGKIGVGLGMLSNEDLEKMGLFELKKEQYSLLQSFSVGIKKGKDQLFGYGKQLKKIANPETGAYKGVGGFKAIYDIFPQTWSWEMFWGITAILSIMLGVMNLLPIPALDGGHVMFLLYEIVTGRKPSDKFMEYAQTVGFFILIGLLLFANGNDIFKAIFGK